MKSSRMIAAAAMVVLALAKPVYPDEAKAAFNRGAQAESKKQYDAASEAFKQAVALKPKDPKYIRAYLRARASATEEHLQKGKALRDQQKLQEALAEFQRAAEIDGTNFLAEQEVRRTAAMLKKQAETEEAPGPGKPESQLAKMIKEVEGPVDIEPSPNTPITLRMTTTADNVYKTIGKLGGINVLFDLDYKPQRVTVELNEVMLREALRMVAMESKTFWRPISKNTIFVAAESKRKEFEENVMKTFYLRNASTPAELQEVVGTLKGLLDINRIQVNPTHSSITVRATPDQLVLAQQLITNADKAKPEVMIDIAVLEVNRLRLRTIGTVVPTSTSITPTAGGVAGTVVKAGSLNGNSFLVPIPGGSFSFLMSDTNTKILQNPEIRALDNEHATLRIGTRQPIATGSFTPGVGAGGISPLVNTQFQYIDVGVNIDITPHIHSDREVTLKMVLEVSSLAGSTNIGGISQPIIGQRRIEHETRVADGEINLVGGILEDTETQSLSGYPWLLKIPILKYLFGQEEKDRTQNEIVFAITPHIVRSEMVTDDDLNLIDVGTGNSIGLRYKEPKSAKPASPAAAPNSSSQHGLGKQTPGAQAQPKPSSVPAAGPAGQ